MIDVSEFVGKTISELRLPGDAHEFTVAFTDGSSFTLCDDQQCCERRYFACWRANLAYLCGTIFEGIEVRVVGQVAEHGGDVSEIAFLYINTRKGTLVLNCYNEHNGYYSGFAGLYVTCRWGVGHE